MRWAASRRPRGSASTSWQPGSNAPPGRDLALPIRIKPGTRLIRQWQGEIHLVEVQGHGFAYRGQRYTSLSAIARTITGTPWSGPVFFGLKRRRAKRHA